MGEQIPGSGAAPQPATDPEPTAGSASGQPPRLPPAQESPISILWIIPLLPAGFVFGLIGGFVQEHRFLVGGIEVPWASLLLIAALVAAVRALSLNLETRKAGILFFVGWLVATALMALPNPSGDVVFSADWGTYLYLGGSALLGAAAAAWPIDRFSEPGPGELP